MQRAAMLALLFMGMLLGLTGCRGIGATYLSEAQGVEFQLLDQETSARIAAVEQLLDNLDKEKLIQSYRQRGAYIVVVTQPMGSRRDPWTVPFVVIWPQRSDEVSLMSWTAIYRFDLSTAEIAREKALKRLRTLVEAACAEDEVLHGRVRLIQ